MSKKVALVGHCGPDSSYLRMIIQKADKGAQIIFADSDEELNHVLKSEVDLLLFNRELGYGFTEPMGVSMIARLRAGYPKTKMMLISNYPDAQEAAVQAGALPGFGKREIGTPRVVQLLKDALA
jgi:hypothetical protein